MSQSVMVTSGSSPVPILPQMSSSLYLNPAEPIFTLEHFQQGSNVCVVFNAGKGHYTLRLNFRFQNRYSDDPVYRTRPLYTSD